MLKYAKYQVKLEKNMIKIIKFTGSVLLSFSLVSCTQATKEQSIAKHKVVKKVEKVDTNDSTNQSQRFDTPPPSVKSNSIIKITPVSQKDINDFENESEFDRQKRLNRAKVK